MKQNYPTRKVCYRDTAVRVLNVMYIPATEALELKEKELKEAEKQLEASKRSLLEKDETTSKCVQLLINNMMLLWDKRTQMFMKYIKRMSWRKGNVPGMAMCRGTAVVHYNTAYFKATVPNDVYSYQNCSGKEVWTKLPDNRMISCGLVIINGLLTSVGGAINGEIKNTLLSLVGESEGRQWSEIFPPMPTPRSCAACVATEIELVVAGGYGREECRFVKEPVDTVEVMNISTKEWFTVCPLPLKCANMSAAVWGDNLFLAGGDISTISETNAVFLCTLSSLLLPTTCGSSDQQMVIPQEDRASVWKEICSLPVTRSTLVSFNDSILAVGGKHQSCYDSKNIYMYNFSSNSWTLVSQINYGRHDCFAVSLPGDILVIVGGHLTNSVEILE